VKFNSTEPLRNYDEEGHGQLEDTCLVVGGGPAGMMLGYLLARSGVQTLLVEKHGDFFRDFRGDTVHPPTTQLMHELGILDEFLRQVPHQTMAQLGIGFNGQTFDLVGSAESSSTKTTSDGCGPRAYRHSGPALPGPPRSWFPASTR
jgi:2-polyprenyl-6-methoxyphenol hydroxylase-like FAD-dependent oxidoreductase